MLNLIGFSVVVEFSDMGLNGCHNPLDFGHLVEIR